jgi:phosphoglycolate phosphatase
VGDRLNDVAAAARHAIPCVGALWGYGGAQELTQAGAARLCAHPSELPSAIRALAAQW